MTTIIGGITATLLGSPEVDLGRVEGTGALDESWAPHVQADLTIAMPDEATLELLDPREARRIRIDAETTYPGSFIPAQTRSFDLGLRDRTIDHEAGTVRLALDSDEALLRDDVLLSDTPIDYWDSRTSLRAIVADVLDRIGATLEPGTDADMTPHWDLTNQLINPSVEDSPTGWAAAGNCTIFHSTPALSPPQGVAAIGMTSSASGLLAVMPHPVDQKMSASAGRSYVFSGYGRRFSTPTGRTMWTGIRFLDHNGAAIGPDREGAPVVLTTTGWTRCHVIATAPPGTTGAVVFFRVAGSTGAGQIAYADCAMFHEGRQLLDYFDGETTDTTDYVFAWNGDANLTPSQRAALNPAEPDALLWRPGVSSWDFVQPLFQRAGMRLFCDEARQWRLVDGSTFVAPGTLQLTAPGTLHRAVDTTNRDGDWYDAALVHYQWIDQTGITREAIDFYGEPGYTKVRTFELTSAYPGPGTARYAVKRAAGRGRTVELGALSNLSTTPSQTLRVNLPDTPELLGVVRSVSFDLSSGTMTVASRGLTDIPDGAYILADPDLTYSAAPAVAYTNWINPNGV